MPGRYAGRNVARMLPSSLSGGAFNESLCDNLTIAGIGSARSCRVHDAAPLIKPPGFQRPIAVRRAYPVSEVRRNNSDYDTP